MLYQQSCNMHSYCNAVPAVLYMHSYYNAVPVVLYMHSYCNAVPGSPVHAQLL